MSPDELAKLTGGTWSELPRKPFDKGACIDSRRLEPGQVFVALATDRADGHDYVPAAFANGAVAALTTRPLAGGPCLVVDDPQTALTAWAVARREAFTGTVIGIVGSVGKTTAKELLTTLLAKKYRVHASPRSFNNELGVPLTLLGLDSSVDVAVVEMGANGPGDLDYLGQLVQPDHLFVTPIGAGHLEGFGDLAGVRRAKAEILTHLKPTGWLALPDDEQLASAWSWSGAQFSWGGTSSDCAPWPTTIEFPGCRIETPSGSVSLGLPALWSGALLAAVCELAQRIGLPVEPLDGEGFEPAAGRLHCRVDGETTWINDAYNANPVSVAHALELLGQVKGRRVVVFGDMLELGDDAEQFHRAVGVQADGLAECLVTVGPLAACAGASFTGPLFTYGDAETCKADCNRWLGEGPVTVLVKGSRAIGLEVLAA